MKKGAASELATVGLIITMILFMATSFFRSREQAKHPILSVSLSGGRSVRGHFYSDQPLYTNEALNVLTNIGYLAGYSENHKVPLWVAYQLFKVEQLEAPPRPSGFKVDDRTKAKLKQSDYTNTGYDRGHMAPNYGISVCYREEAQQETFLMSNVIPQQPKLNRNQWKKLELDVAKKLSQHFENAWVITGPILGTNTLACGANIPQFCFKIITVEVSGCPLVLAYLMPQKPSGLLSEYTCSVDDIEKLSDIDFFHMLPDRLEDRLEEQNTNSLNSLIEWGREQMQRRTSHVRRNH